MPNEIPQELLDQMIHMNNEQFDDIEKRWRDNLTVKKAYERQYYAQLQGYLDYNSTFRESQRSLKPHEHAAFLDQELLSEAQSINQDRVKTDHIEQQQALENPKPPQIGERAKDITAQLFAAMEYETLEREWETRLNYPANDLYPTDHDIELER
ncbi:hypothetical protein SAMN04488128_101232 [Chitinophaga eiseniae]|uniref:Uncharacterized protein n=1 Tax=Chitinophaga eiseniae TaxID=634771 RepID=A0A1T4KP23_9BACT|nr:hypothetical protein [Chitinophaga eiseniae]SJZ44170.1 hypothetical protein SAMN04488128_101232 [Chitinophaga eiseniae]